MTDRCETCEAPVTPGETFFDEPTGMEVCSACDPGPAAPITRESERAANAGIAQALGFEDRAPTMAEALQCVLDLAGEAMRNPTDREAKSFALVSMLRDHRAAEDA